MSKIYSIPKAIDLIKDGDTIVVNGNGSIHNPDTILEALEERFLKTGSPNNLTEIHPSIPGDLPGTGLDRFAHKGMVKRTIGSCYHAWQVKKISAMVLDNQIEGYCLPMGVLYQLLRAISAGQPGLVTDVGLNTFVDPINQGGKLNTLTKEDIVERIILDGKNYLRYKPFHVDVAIIKGSVADGDGNISLKYESNLQGAFSCAAAAKACGGKVIALVKYEAQKGSLNTQEIIVPGGLVDAVVVDNDTLPTRLGFDPSYNSLTKTALNGKIDVLPLDVSKVICRRCAQEFKNSKIINLGFGIPDRLPYLAYEEGILGDLTFSLEHGTIGGIPAPHEIFGAAINPETIIDSTSAFEIFDGGGFLDMTVLGFGQIDRYGNTNVLKFGPRFASIGGYMNITHKTRKIIFCGAFTAGGLKIKISNTGIQILEEGRVKKFKKDVEAICYSGQLGYEKGQEVLYITERAVFELAEGGICLTEIAPGIDIEKDIIGQMEFEPHIAKDIRIMDQSLFV